MILVSDYLTTTCLKRVARVGLGLKSNPTLHMQNFKNNRHFGVTKSWGRGASQRIKKQLNNPPFDLVHMLRHISLSHFPKEHFA